MTATAFIDDPLLDQPAAPVNQLRTAGEPDRPPAVVIAIDAGRRERIEQFRRRRFVAALVATVVILVVSQLAGVSLLSFGTGSVASSPGDEVPVVHIVRPGDTYGAIATELGAGNPLAVAEQLRSANGGAELAVGQRLVVDLTALD